MDYKFKLFDGVNQLCVINDVTLKEALAEYEMSFNMYEECKHLLNNNRNWEDYSQYTYYYTRILQYQLIDQKNKYHELKHTYNKECKKFNECIEEEPKLRYKIYCLENRLKELNENVQG